MTSLGIGCTLGVFPAPAFAADKKSSRKIKYKKIPGVHYELTRDLQSKDISTVPFSSVIIPSNSFCLRLIGIGRTS